MSRKTAGKYLRQDNVMEQRRVPHTWRTREDPLREIWPMALKRLRDAPELEAKALFEHLERDRGESITPGLLRTFQRRVRQWRLAEGPDKEVFFTQDHKPGEVLAVDWTDMGSLGITIEGRALAHKLFHAVLPYSNWEWAVRVRSESTLSLRTGLKAALGRLGKVPRQVLSDHSSTATHQLRRGGSARVFNEEYLGICAHYGIEPRTINVGRPQENGSCESSHGHLKRRIRQHLLLRGGGDFASEREYDDFLIKVLESANLRRTQRLGEELSAMGETAIEELPDYRELMVSVRNDSTIRVNKSVYSVPSRLIGVKLLPPKVRRQLPALIEGSFVERSVNVLVFGLPGRGKTHFLAALGRELILRHSKRVLFRPAFKLVGQLLAAKRDLRLEQELKKLDRYDVLILDDIGYVQQSREEMEVLFTLLAERYERRSLLISSNLVFSQWDQIFKDAMTTMAAIDRLVHHSIILEFDGSSQRARKAGEKGPRADAG